ncbi:MAG: hypothetical protein DWQ18_00250 [Crenarchaeota archaeon]|nr:MAG: hypothetical protein DWQ17_04965 [Thermoproteota archaeon]RDJ34418.1 MAG: hypothetical protein DWQ18_00250 [Thermoproteota archaeon]RDJ34757.1 MAG: hypothetical protein DWQ19_13365 [Thermoproteota archaeon]RDJ38642.1 MAG: hypothetical protein DWQ13_04570 [Thermoproteota archaeon]
MDLIITDIHADFSALESILKVANDKSFKKKFGEFSRILNLGDVLERGTHPKEVLEKFSELSKSYPFESVNGNHDEGFLYRRKVSGSSFESLHAHKILTEDDLSFFKKNKDGSIGRQEFIDEKNKIICVHGGPLDPTMITPENAGDESWLYEKCWQRLSEEDFEFFSYAGYHYTATSAFNHAKKRLDNFVIFCGHEHMEAVLEERNGTVKNQLRNLRYESLKIGKHSLEQISIPIKQDSNYIIRLGLGGPEGYYGTGMAKPHFGIYSKESGNVSLFTINTS